MKFFTKDGKPMPKAIVDMAKEAKSGGTNMPVPASAIQEAEDKKMQDKAKQAPTTKTEMGKLFSKGGSASSRADGCAQRGKTKGRII